jgi:hypothetical protein
MNWLRSSSFYKKGNALHIFWTSYLPFSSCRFFNVFSHWYMKKILILVLAGLMLAGCWKSCSRKDPGEEEKSKYLNTDPSVTYVGMDVCKNCHSDIYQTFIQTGMGRSFDFASRKKSAARFGFREIVYDTFRNLYYHPQFTGDTLQVLEFRLEGKDTIYKHIQNIRYIVGSGQHTNSHIYEVNGFLYQAPMTFYTQKGEWNLPPGFEHGSNSRFGRAIELECISCHNDYPVFDAQSINRYEVVKQGITCERCHGPGSLHVAEKQKGNIVDITRETDYTIVNPSKLPWQLQIDVCQRCHLQGNAVLKKGKTFFDFRPGTSLSRVMDVYMPKYEGDDSHFIMASHAERLQMSQCFIKSNASGNNENGQGLNMTCITCHNPHISVKVTGKDVFNTACQKCHQGASAIHCSATAAEVEKEQNNCVKCHMPVNTTTDIPHVTVHDHYIRKPMKEQETAALRQFAGIYCVNNKKADDESKAEAYLNYYEKFDPSQASALDSAFFYANKCNDRPDLWIHYFFLVNNYKEVIRFGKKINVNATTDPWTCYRVAESYLREGNPELAEVWIDQAVQVKPKALDFLQKKGYILYVLNRPAEARKIFESILSYNPQYAEAWSSIGLIICDKGYGDMNKALEYYNRALSLDPDLETALINSLDVFNATGDKNSFMIYLKRLYKINPKNPKLIPFYDRFLVSKQ